MDLSSISITLAEILEVLFVIYLVLVIGVILLDNRSPQSTFAWLFLMLSFPVLGFIVYIMFGRGYRAFSHENKLARIGGPTSLYALVIKPLLDVQNDYTELILREKPES